MVNNEGQNTQNYFQKNAFLCIFAKPQKIKLWQRKKYEFGQKPN